MYYEDEICGVRRRLPLCAISGGLYIAAFNMLGDNALTKAVALAAHEKIKDIAFDVLVTAECKGIAFVQEVSRLLFESRGQNYFVAARKGFKLYMNDPVSVDVQSITTESCQKLWLSKDEADKLKGKRVIIADDVISTGRTVDALYKLLEGLGAEVVAELCVYAEGEACDRNNIIYLKKLPLFDKDGRTL
jgi:adenine phosphoribosyltransferase